ncbi:trypsin-like peptidase domain-containing protein [bacterium]|nr:trypsin-like peptidase domain-containing protein [bacterium]
MPQDSPIIRAVRKVLPAIVSITMSKCLEFFESPSGIFGLEEFFGTPRRKKVKIGGGSGFIVDSSGIILTNRHVVEDPQAEYIVVLQNEEKYTPEILARDPINDVAILKIEKGELPTVELGDSSKLQLGQEVIAIGNALGLFQNTVSTGVVSGLSREIKAKSDITQEKTRLRGLIQTDAAINPGNSGGPLIDIEGKAIGINAAMVFGAENIGFALPINNAKKDLEELKKYGRVRQPFLGVRYLPITKELKERFNLPIDFGALVISEPDVSKGIKQAVVPGSPAARAGLKEADIILEIGNKKITADQPLDDALQNFKIGQQLPLKILRHGRQKTLKIILGEKK